MPGLKMEYKSNKMPLANATKRANLNLLKISKRIIKIKVRFKYFKTGDLNKKEICKIFKQIINKNSKISFSLAINYIMEDFLILLPQLSDPKEIWAI